MPKSSARPQIETIFINEILSFEFNWATGEVLYSHVVSPHLIFEEYLDNSERTIEAMCILGKRFTEMSKRLSESDF
jgi:hypothetical protein